jgi:hypothetical protein
LWIFILNFNVYRGVAIRLPPCKWRKMFPEVIQYLLVTAPQAIQSPLAHVYRDFGNPVKNICNLQKLPIPSENFLGGLPFPWTPGPQRPHKFTEGCQKKALAFSRGLLHYYANLYIFIHISGKLKVQNRTPRSYNERTIRGLSFIS